MQHTFTTPVSPVKCGKKMSQKNMSQKNWVNKIWIKKIWGKKFTPERVITPKGAQVGRNWSFLFFRWRYLKIKFEAKWLKIALFRTDHTFWDPKLPHLQKEYKKFAYRHILDIIMQQKPVKFQVY